MTNDKARTEKRRGVGSGALLALMILLGVGCSREESQRPTAAENTAPTAPTEGRQVFQVRGVVQEVRLGEQEVVIRHEEIPNYMPAMTMPFEVKNTNELTGLAANDQVSFRMIVTEEEGWIEDVKKTGVDTTSQGKEPRAHTRLVRDVEPLAVGDKMTNYPFTNSLGEKIELNDFAGQAYAFSFIFTRCPFPNFCPRMNMNFEKAFQQLTSMENAPTNWHLISISFDPEFDTPERLKEYSATYKPDPKKWSWVTGALIEIDAITEQLGLAFAFENNTINHNLRTVVVDKDGVIRHIFWGNEWKPEELVKEIVAGAEGKEVGKY
ncbi:MAG: SCO family protein [Limisphaerales bacterium]